MLGTDDDMLPLKCMEGVRGCATSFRTGRNLDILHSGEHGRSKRDEAKH